MNRPLNALAVGAALVLSLAACGSSTPQATASPNGSTSTTDSAPSPAAGASAAVSTVSLTVVKGKVTGDTGRANVKLGSTVDVAVTADVAQEVHIHGYDLMVDTIPGQTVHKQFTANIPGIFEIELEQSKTTLTHLQVQ